MKPLADYLMDHGILKNADAETMATEIEARFARERDELRATVEKVRVFLDAGPNCETMAAVAGLEKAYRSCVERAERAEAKCAEMRHVLEQFDWEDACVEAFPSMRDWEHALSTDCGKPTAQPCHECREVTLPMISVIGPNVPRGTGKPRQFCSIHCFWKWIQRVEKSRDEGGYGDRVYSWD